MSCLSRDHMDKQLSTLNRKLGQTEEQIKGRETAKEQIMRWIRVEELRGSVTK